MKSSLPYWFVALALLVGVAWAGWLGQRHLAGLASPIDRAETVLLDMRILAVGPRPAPPEVVIVGIDDETITKAGRYPIGRDRLAELIGKIRNAGAKALGIDMLLVGNTDDAADARLTSALGSLPSVIAAAGVFKDDNRPVSAIPAPDSILPPLPEFATVASVGLVNVAADAGGTPRHIPLLFMTPEGPEPSLSLRALGLYLGDMPALTAGGVRLPGGVQPLDLGWHLPLNYYGPMGTVRTVSAQDLFDGTPGAAAAVKDRLVLLGATATGVGDRFSTPFDQILPGVEVLATGVSNLMDGSALIRDDLVRKADMAAALLITLAGMAAAAFLPLAVASVLFVLILCGWLAAATLLLGDGYWFSAALPLAASVPPVIGLAILRQVFDRYQMRRLETAQDALSRFQAPELARRIAEDPSFLREPSEQDAAVLFVDLAGYTGLSERMGPARTREFLQAFHTIVVNETERHHGLAMSFMGDGAMICFGIPDPGPKDAVNAWQCTFDLVREVGKWMAGTGLRSGTGALRAGVHFGPVVLSRLGHEHQQQITVTGDCVNVASRLMEVAKEHDSLVAMSSELMEAAAHEADSDLHAPRTETVAIRGRQQAMLVGLWTALEAEAVKLVVPAN